MKDPANDQSKHDENGEGNEAPPSPDGENGSATEAGDDAAPKQDSPTDAEFSSSSADSLTLVAAQKRARKASEDLLEHQFEGIIKAESTNGEGWRTVVEVIERNAVPDTQDIIGRYEITLDETGNVTGYELLERYRRGDMKEEL